MDNVNPAVSKAKKICVIVLVIFLVVDLICMFALEGYAKSYFPSNTPQIDKWSFAFYATYAFVVCAILAVVAKRIFGQVLQREEGYYDD